ncbi:uncharacterized protein LOC143146820 [Ptiloglossa arizonensis]|uniref:uncharacterized protein LOC143146820 n=1 Tax=Ptiloglossa arizonensis TaxID=3350558 RepID=UPI003F9F0549
MLQTIVKLLSRTFSGRQVNKIVTYIQKTIGCRRMSENREIQDGRTRKFERALRNIEAKSNRWHPQTFRFLCYKSCTPWVRSIKSWAYGTVRNGKAQYEDRNIARYQTRNQHDAFRPVKNIDPRLYRHGNVYTYTITLCEASRCMYVSIRHTVGMY